MQNKSEGMKKESSRKQDSSHQKKGGSQEKSTPQAGHKRNVKESKNSNARDDK